MILLYKIIAWYAALDHERGEILLTLNNKNNLNFYHIFLIKYYFNINKYNHNYLIFPIKYTDLISNYTIISYDNKYNHISIIYPINTINTINIEDYIHHISIIFIKLDNSFMFIFHLVELQHNVSNGKTCSSSSMNSSTSWRSINFIKISSRKYNYSIG